MGRRVAVTGATGFVGWNLVERLRNRGWEVRGTVRPNRPRPLPDGVEPVAVSLTRSSLVEKLRGVETIVHLAGLTDAPTTRHFQQVNVGGTQAVARAARDLGAHLVHVSSQAAAGPASPDAPRQEGDPPNPITSYGMSKLAGEHVVRQTPGLSWTILRPCSIYGPRDRGFITLFRLARRGVFLTTGTARVAYTLVHVDDVARAIERVATPGVPPHDVFFIGHAEQPSEEDMWRTLARLFGRRYRPVNVPYPLVWTWALVGDLGRFVGLSSAMTRSRLRELRAGGFVCSVQKAHAMLGFEAAIDMETGFEATARWYVDNGWLRGPVTSL